MAYYDGTKLLSLKDKNGNKPGLYFAVGNRSAGKTTWFGRYAVNSFVKGKGQFILLYRFNNELDGVADKFFPPLKELFFHGYDLKAESRSKGLYRALVLCRGGSEEICGYAVAINNSDQLKKVSHVFSDVKRIIFDEFQSETDHYCADEVTRFLSLYSSVARGHGNMSRHVPVYFISNNVSVLNPYYAALGMAKEIKPDTKILKGVNWVLENTVNESAKAALSENPVIGAFSSTEYAKYASGNTSLNDSWDDVSGKPPGRGRYLATVRHDGKLYGVTGHDHDTMLYVSSAYDSSFPTVLSAEQSVRGLAPYVPVRYVPLIGAFRDLCKKGAVRYESYDAKNAFVQLCAYR